MKRAFPLLFSAVAAVLFAADKSRDWNVLLVTVDTLRWDHVGIYGRSPVPTPALDRLARKSLLFLNAYSHNPVTLPAHANILTGLLPIQHGVSDNAIFVLAAGEWTLAEHLKANGYQTAAFIGSYSLHSQFGLAQGFDLYEESFAAGGRGNGQFVERPAAEVLAAARKWLAGRRGKWFAWVHLFDPHFPYTPPSPYRERYARNPYAGEVAYVDAEVGKFIEWFEREGFLANTAIVVTGDHGESLGEKDEVGHTYFAYNNTIRVPLFVRVPGMAAKTVVENVAHIDIFPSLCDLLSLPLPKGMPGVSLFASGRGGRRPDDRIYFESLTPYYACKLAPLRGFVRGGDKFIDLPLPEFYQLDRDPDESENRIRDQDIASLRRSLQELMNQYGRKRSSRPQAVISTEALNKLRSLGYLGSDAAGPPEERFSEKEDLKTMLPAYNVYMQGVQDLESGRIEGAYEKFTQTTQNMPGNVVVYSLLADIERGRGRMGEAIRHLKRGLSRNRGNLFLQSRLGIAQIESGEIEDGARAMRRCLEESPGDPAIRNYLGLALFLLGSLDEAQEQYEKVLAIDARYAPALNNLGNLLLERARRSPSKKLLDRAAECFDRAVRLAPDMANARNGQALVLYRQGRARDAIGSWLAAEKAFPRDRQILFNLGIAYLESGAPREALARFQRCRQLFGPAAREAEKQSLEKLIAEAEAQIR